MQHTFNIFIQANADLESAMKTTSPQLKIKTIKSHAQEAN